MRGGRAESCVPQTPTATRNGKSEVKLSLGVKLLVIVICVLISLIVAIVATWINHSSGASIADAVLFGGGAFAGCMILCLAVLSTFSVL